MKIRIFLLLAVISQPISLLAQNLVVWDFATRDGHKNDLTVSLTYEFEEALATAIRTYAVLERRNFDRLQVVIENEKALQNIGQITPTASKEVKQMGVSIVAFGEVFDDIKSGDISIAVMFQDFTGKKLLVKSILMRRGLALDAASRRERMTTLAQAISDAAIKASRLPETQEPAQPQPARLIFRVLPEDALIYIDGKNAGIAKGLSKDQQGTIVDPGSRSIGIGRTGYKSLRRDINIGLGETMTVQETLIPESPGGEEQEKSLKRANTGRPCFDNFSEEGSFFKGRLYKSWQNFSAMKGIVFKRIAQSVIVNGWYDVRADEELGVITALSQKVIGGQGARLPLNIVVDSKDDKEIRVEVIFIVNPLQTSSTAAIRSDFCKLLEYAD